MGSDVGLMRRAIREEQKRFRDRPNIVVGCVADCIAEPRLRGLVGQMHRVPFGSERFGDETTHRRLSGAINALETHEAGEHV